MTKPAHSAREIAADVAAGRTNAVETAKAALARIEAAKALNAVVTIEPGVYIEGLAGIRIEDTVLVTKTGCEVLTPTSKEFIHI